MQLIPLSRPIRPDKVLMICVWDYWGQREGTLNVTIGAIFLLCAAVAGRVLLFLSGM